MYQGYLIIFGSMILVGCPVLIPIVLIVLGCLYWFAPDSFTALLSWLRRGSSSRTATIRTTETSHNIEGKGFTTYKEMQEREVNRHINPNWDPNSPENKKVLDELRSIMARNKAINDREWKEKISKEKADNARKRELGQSVKYSR